MFFNHIFSPCSKLTHLPKYAVIILTMSIAACGAGNSENKPEQVPDQTNPPEDQNPDQNTLPVEQLPDQNPPLAEKIPDQQAVPFDHTVLLKENQPVTAPLTSLSTDLNDPAFVLQLQSNGFPNFIKSITTHNGLTLTESSDIEQLFVLFINPRSGEVEVKVNKEFDYENSSESYALDIMLGTESIKVLVRLFDIQKGSSEEPLKINSYNELTSFFSGQFVSEHIGNDIIELSNPSSNSHNTDDLFIQLGQDIDASSSSEAPWPGYIFHGQLHGNSYVINNLSIAAGKGFIDNPDRFKVSRIKHIGFTNTQLSATLIRSSAYGSILDSVSLSGKVTSPTGSTFYFSPFRVAGEFTKVYTNLYYDLANISSSSRRVEISALVGNASAPINFRSGYSNGSIHMNKTVKVNTTINGFANGFADLSDFGYAFLKDSLFYSAIDFELSENQELYGDRGYIQAGALSNSYLDYPVLTAVDSAYNWRFITDRNSTGRIQTVGNGHRDINNSGQSSEEGRGPDLGFAGMTSIEAKRATTFTGLWVENNVFDITEGEFPVLKGMPYPHTEGAVWMEDAAKQDPGIAYQRATYNDYLTAP